MRAWLACAEIMPSGIRRATHTAPLFTFLPSTILVPLPIISNTHTSFGSATEIDSPDEAYPYSATNFVMNSTASRAVRHRCKAMYINDP